ncbi:MAG TPA: methyltransferase domain-containing protein, partial [Candidatus Absconditabacterales bacterium]|nr:methyltransferase domain-containing protein [Candidatus Absconditabacterales bacterium]
IFDKLISTPLSQGGIKGGLKTIESTFRISPFSFFQTNTHGAEKLFQTGANALAQVQGKILDLYCGTGSIGINFLNMGIGDSVLGIDIVQEAIKDANYNAEINGLKEKCKFIASPSEKIFKNYPEIQNELNNIGLVIVDPPREGLHKNVIERIENLKKENKFELLYISCNPTTMARDIELFVEKGFKIKSLQPVDMFPQTHHIETVGVLI